jgi:hypothetical protein
MLSFVANTNTNGANPQIDEMLFQTKISNATITYAFADPVTDPDFYSGSTYTNTDPSNMFFAYDQQLIDWSVYALNNAASFAQLNFSAITQTTSNPADISGYYFNQPPSSSFFYGYSSNGLSNDRTFIYEALGNPPNYLPHQVGTYVWNSVLHEQEHMLGIGADGDMGPFDAQGRSTGGLLPLTSIDNQEWTAGGYPAGLIINNATDMVGAMTYMPYDIQALQWAYGTRYGASHTYSWDSSGNWYIDGAVQPYAEPNHTILQSVWDAGANGQYDFSNFSSNATIDIRPGGIINLGTQIAYIGRYSAQAAGPWDTNHYTVAPADGNIFNAFVDPHDTSETDSLIRRVTLGTGSSTVYLNAANDTVIAGTSGSANIVGGGGQNVLEVPYSYASYTYQQSGGAWIVSGNNQSFTLNNVALVEGPDGAVALGTFTGLPSGTTGTMLMDQSSTGTYQMYDLGNNAILGSSFLGRFDANLQVLGLGHFYGNQTADIMLRNTSTGMFEIEDFSNNRITNAVTLCAVGTNWTVQGFGNFSGGGYSDMMLRDSSTGQFAVYDISNNAITGSNTIGTVGLSWTIQGFGDFSTNSGETDMMLRNSSTGQFYIYDISGGAITGSSSPFTISDMAWAPVGFGNFSGNTNETDMMLRNSSTGQFYIYDFQNNQFTAAYNFGTVGLDWQVAGFAPIHGAGASDMLLRSASTGEIYDYEISGNQLVGAVSLGTVGTDWSVAATGSDPSNIAYLAQSMASFGTDAGLVGPTLTVQDMNTPQDQLAIAHG